MIDAICWPFFLIAIGLLISSVIILYDDRSLLSERLPYVVSVGTAIAFGTYYILNVAGISVPSSPLYGQLHAISSFPILSFMTLFTAIAAGIMIIAPKQRFGTVQKFQILFFEGSVLAFCSTTDVRMLLMAWAGSLVPAFISESDFGFRWRWSDNRAFGLYQVAGLVCLIAGTVILHTAIAQSSHESGYALVDFARRLGQNDLVAHVAGFLFVTAVFIRQGLFPLHSGIVSMATKSPLPYVTLFLCSQLGFLFLINIGHETVVAMLTVQSNLFYAFTTVSAIYFAVLALVQRDSRRAFIYIVLMHSAVMPLFLASAHSSSQIAVFVEALVLTVTVAGFGSTLWLFERRTGIRSFNGNLGMSARMPRLAGLFLIFGLCCVNAPLTLGFVSEDLLLHKVFEQHPLYSVPLLTGFAIGGIAVFSFYALLFLGKLKQDISFRDLKIHELTVLALFLIFLVGLGFAPGGMIKIASVNMKPLTSPPPILQPNE